MDSKIDSELSCAQIEEAFRIWRNSLPTKQFDQLIETQPRTKNRTQLLMVALDQAFLTEAEKYELQIESRLQLARRGLGLSSNEVASRLGVSRRVYSNYEASERKGKIQIDTLRKAAAAMNCELTYTIRPLSNETYSKELWLKVLPQARQHPWVVNGPKHLKARRLATIAKNILNNPEFREANDLSERAKTYL